MAYAYDEQRVSVLLYDIIQRHLTEKAAKWFSDQQAIWFLQDSIQHFNLVFSAAPRFLGRAAVELTPEEEVDLDMVFDMENASRVVDREDLGNGKVIETIEFSSTIYPFVIKGYTIDRLFRAWWLLQLPITDKARYIQTIENLFLTAEMNELVALYGALPLLAFPQEWTARTAEGIRSNIGSVLEAIMLENPYPAQYLNEAAWNQLVLKAFFTDKPVHRIFGLDERANAALAHTLSDLAHERWAAGRAVNPMSWRLVGPFINETNFADIERVWHSEYHAEREAAALACASTSYAAARALLEKRPDVLAEIAQGKLTWETVALRING